MGDSLKMDYKTDEKLLIKKLQQAQLNLLIELDRVCKIIGVPYCLAFGTSLGAKRHKGFIPWDDDIDIYMRIEDLKILQKNGELFKEEFFLQHHGSEAEYGLMITRLRDSNTTLIEEKESDRNINHGIFIDIYPLFNTPKDGLGAKKLVVASMFYRLLLYGKAPQNRGLIMKLGSIPILILLPKSLKEKIMRKCYHIMQSYNKTGYISDLYGDEVNNRMPEKWFFPVKLVPFENLLVPVQANQHEYLKSIYGDYMQLPPVEERKFHHDYVCIDFDKPYTSYKGKLYCKE